MLSVQQVYFKNELDVHQRINLKSWFGGYDAITGLGNGVSCYKNSHCKAPAIMTFCGIAQHDCYYGKYKKGARLDGVTDT